MLILAAAILLLQSPKVVDSSSLVGKVLCGYQGWFRTPTDPTGRGWVHWGPGTVTPKTITFEMWPDVQEYPPETLCPAGDFTLANGRPALLFSSVYQGVVDKHFDWMRQYGIDGVMVQRFLGGLDGAEGSSEEARVLVNVAKAAVRTGRTFAVEYDMSGTPPERAIEIMRKDWRFLVDKLKITENPRYLRYNGKPVLEVFGFFTDRFSGQQANAIIDSFDTKDKYAVSLVGAGQWWWRNERNSDWHRAFRRFVAYSPWDVGNVEVVNEVKKPPTSRWAEDLAEAKRANMLLFPVIYPGFSWDNLMRKKPGSSIIPRRKGQFFREGFEAATKIGVGQAFIAMFDEVDEGTAIFKVTNQTPTTGHFVDLEGLPSDTYLRIAGEGTKTIHRAHGRTP